MNRVTFPNGKTYFTDSALAICATGVMARANIVTLESWGEEEYGDDFLERATHYRFNRPDVEEYHAGAYPTKPLVFTSDGRMGDDAAAWVREDVWQRWALGDMLESYPILDEKKYAVIEALARQEAFQNWICVELESAMESAGFSEQEMEKFTALRMYELFLDAIPHADAEWSEESGGSMWIAVDKVLPHFLSAARNHLAKEAVV